MRRSGLQAFVKFVKLYDAYRRDYGATNREGTGVTRYEAELLLGDIDPITPRPFEHDNPPIRR